MTGPNLYDYCNEEKATFFEGVCVGYILGVIDILGRGGAVAGANACIPSGPNVGQIKDIVVKWLTNNPEVRHFSAEGLVAVAISEVFPCR